MGETCANLCRWGLLVVLAACHQTNQGPGAGADDGSRSVFADTSQRAWPSPQPPNSCFGAGTPVLTPTGERPIEALRVGDQVVAFDHARGRRVVRTVTATRHVQRSGLGQLRLGNGRRLAVTPEHPFFVDGRYLPIAQVDGSQPLLMEDGALTGHGGFEPASDDRLATVYDLTVGGTHNFFVAGVLVHNKTYPAESPPPPPPPSSPCDANPAACDKAPPPRFGLPRDGSVDTAMACETQADCAAGVCACDSQTCLQFSCRTRDVCAEYADELGAATPEASECIDGLCSFVDALPLKRADCSPDEDAGI